jgi:regulator of sirC expression with transglutaminase-like and TPR domain
MNAVTLFAEAFHRSDATPEHLALAIARLAYPALDVREQLHQLDLLATYVRGDLASPSEGSGSEAPGLPSAEEFLGAIKGALDFRGNREDYYDARNSLLPDVLERRLGLPIMLCLVCMALGRRIGVQIDGLGFPSHFMAIYRDPTGQGGDMVLDPFMGVVLPPGEVERHLARVLDRPLQLTPELWRPLSAQEIAMRILHNLRNAYLTAKDLPMVRSVLDYLIAANPSDAQYWRERGLLNYRQRHWVDAHYDLRRYLMRTGLIADLPVTSESSVGTPQSLPLAKEGDRRVLEIYREIGNMLARIN